MLRLAGTDFPAPCPGPTIPVTEVRRKTTQKNSAVQAVPLFQAYTYDGANRLLTAAENGSGWTQSYNYDNNGNMYVNGQTGLGQLSSPTPQSPSWFANGNNEASDPANPWTYDPAGNLMQIPQAWQFTYDAENRQVTAAPTSGGAATAYSYDGLGQRVAKAQQGAQSVTYVYDAWGNLAAEYGGTPAPCTSTPCYLTQDHLGSLRLLTDAGGNTVRRYDWMPFGQPMPANADGRTTAEGYSSPWDGTNPAFVEQYMDLETGLEYFPARYLSPLQGRFQSPDPGNAGADPSDPQTWNGYAYVGSNPLSAVDPTGLLAEAGGGGDDSGGAGGAFVAFFVFIGDEIASAFGGGPSLSLPTFSTTVFALNPLQMVPSADSSTLAAFRGLLTFPRLPFFPNLFAAEATAKAAGDVTPTNPCVYAGRALDPSAYAAAGKAAANNPVKSTLDLNKGFAIGGYLDAQPLATGNVYERAAYGNYVFGAYMASAGFPLFMTLGGADAIAAIHKMSNRRQYSNRKMHPTYGSLPAANVANITNGYNAARNGTLCHK
jgi:RHS repeat-associated protein